MGLVSLYLGLAAASAAAQVPHHEQPQQPVADQREAPPLATEPLVYRLPAAQVPAEPPKRIALAKDIVWPVATPPPLPADPFSQPTADWWQGNSAIKLNVVGVKFGWDL